MQRIDDETALANLERAMPALERDRFFYGVAFISADTGERIPPGEVNFRVEEEPAAAAVAPEPTQPAQMNRRARRTAAAIARRR